MDIVMYVLMITDSFGPIATSTILLLLLIMIVIIQEIVRNEQTHDVERVFEQRRKMEARHWGLYEQVYDLDKEPGSSSSVTTQ